MRSSYIENNFGDILKEYVIDWQPSSFVELGVLDGYSTIHIAEGLKELERLRTYKAVLDAYDLFEDYPYKHGSLEEVQKFIDEKGLTQYVNLKKGNAYKVYENYPDRADGVRGIEYLHIDLSNTGKVINDIMELWHPKIGHRGIVLIEGGSEERDNVQWMKDYNCQPIKNEINTNKIINKFYIYGTYLRYPSMTVLLRKWWDIP